MTLQTTWFFLWGLLWAIFFMMEGFDFGVGTLLPFIGKTDDEKRIMINAIGPTWNGNEVWLITAGGVTFAAFPKVYAVMFSSLYSALMLILFALILRGVSFEFRSKVETPLWRKFWDGCSFVGSAAPAVLFGVAFANIFKGGDVRLEKETCLWASKAVINSISTAAQATVKVNGASDTVTVMGNTIGDFNFTINGNVVVVPGSEIQGGGEPKYTIDILESSKFPLIFKLDIGWTAVLTEIKNP